MAYKPFDLTGKTAILTGAFGGLGLAMGEALTQAGANVCVWDIDANKKAAAEEALARHGGKAKAMLVDVTDEAAVAEAIKETASTFGGLHAAFANAGHGSGGGPTLFEIQMPGFHRTMTVNVDGVFYTLREAARVMRDAGEGGSLVATSSVAAIRGLQGAEHYAASKGAVISMVRSMALELARHNIRVNAILPGPFVTDISRAFKADPLRNEQRMNHTPMGRWAEPEELGGLAIYLASDASRYHTGDDFVVDGGYSVY
jgi:NAD(P)-dependent dehydrogenase (short-subunit alcohol dehydrogenase family)